MEHIGIDVHKNQSQICILTPEGELIEKRICTERGRFAAFLGDREPSRVVIEAATESEWVARCVESLGHEVIVADPNFAPMYARRSRKVKTDRRDARALAEACRLGAYRPAHRASDEQRHVRGHLAAREALVRTRAKFICVVRSLLRREGLRVRSGGATTGFRALLRLAHARVPSGPGCVLGPSGGGAATVAIDVAALHGRFGQRPVRCDRPCRRDRRRADRQP